MTETIQEASKKLRSGLAALWAGIREVSGDSAYERYLERQRRRGEHRRLSPEEFYRQRLERKYNRKDSPARCC